MQYGPLGRWVRDQRCAYQRMKRGQKTHMDAEKALKLSEIGFMFDASSRAKSGQSSNDSI